jgi:aldose 1-epimerase
MDSISAKLDRIRITNKEWAAEIIPGYSMNLISLRFNDREIIRTPKNNNEFLENHIVYGNTLIMPPDRTVGGSFVFENKEYFLPINDPRGNNNLHGLMTDADFEIIQINGSSVRGRYENHGERYPFSFTCEISLQLTENGLKEILSFTNIEDHSIPLLFGLHTNFVCQQFLMVPGAGEYIFDRISFTPGSSAVPLTSLGKLLKEGFNPTGTAVSNFLVSESNTAIIDDFMYTVSPNFTHWVAWNGGGTSGFASVEPENGPANGLNMKNGYVLLDAGKTVCYDTLIHSRNSTY